MTLELLVLALLGVATGLIAGFFGMGGGTLLVPTLMLFGFDIKEAIGISVMQMMFTSIFGSYINLKKDMLRVRDGSIIGIGGFGGALLSGYILHIVPSSALEFGFLGLILFAIYRFFRADLNSQKSIDSSPLKLIVIGFFAGITAISLGVGGALILTPMLVGYMGYKIKDAVSISLFFVIFSSISGFISLSYFGHINFISGFIVGMFSLVGVYVGIFLLQKTSQKRHRKLIIALYFLILIVLVEQIFIKS